MSYYKPVKDKKGIFRFFRFWLDRGIRDPETGRVFRETRSHHGAVMISALGNLMIYKYNQIENELNPKIYLIDSSWTSWPLNRVAKYSLKDIEEAIEKSESKEKIEKMLKKHEALIEVLKPYKDQSSLEPDKPIYSDLYEKKYSELKKEFLAL